MATKADFNAEEWSKLLQGPPLAGLLVIAAERGGTIRESLSMGRVYAEARQRHDSSDLVNEIIASQPEVDPQRYGSPEALRTQGIASLREAAALLREKAGDEDARAYGEFVLDLARTVAGSHKEGGFMGFGGKDVSDAEQAAIDEIAGAVGAS
jgi:hypothetical protein